MEDINHSSNTMDDTTGVPSLTLNTGAKMPIVGYGTYFGTLTVCRNIECTYPVLGSANKK